MTGCLEPSCCDVVASNEFFVNLQNAEAANLLDPQTAGGVDLSNTRLFLIENRASKMFKFEGGGVLDNPYGVAPIGIDGKAGAQISFIYDGNQKEIEGFIQWNEVLANTLTFTFNSAENPRHLVQISQDENPLWDLETDQEYPVSITLTH